MTITVLRIRHPVFDLDFNRRTLLQGLIALALMLYCTACSTDEQPAAAGIDASVPATPDAGVSAAVKRGQYLVASVLSCGDCHTPRAADGKPIVAKLLSGVECFIDAHPPATDGLGCVHSANLTPDATGLARYSDDEVKRMLRSGLRPDHSVLVDVMPYWAFSLLSDSDADAIVAYLRTIPAVAHDVPANEPPFDKPDPARLLTDADIPRAADGPQAGASNGRALASVACLECHTPDLAPRTANSTPQDISRPFQGGRVFQSASLGLPVPPFPAQIVSANLTPDDTGLAGWSVADITKVLHSGIDNEGHALCPPMPFGPMGGFAGLTDSDASDIANYLLHLQPAHNVIASECIAPGAP
jgi:mono/diheme cytochrome c family protein